MSNKHKSDQIIRDFTEKIDDVNFDNIINERYMNYTFHVMEDRAIPDARDGLKPVQRRILFGMKDLGLKASGTTSKCAKVVGHVMGNYHPHGDLAIYDTLINMTQHWKTKYPLTTKRGNFGSIHGHPAAAARYCVTGDTLVNTTEGMIPITNFVNGCVDVESEGHIINHVNKFF